MFTGLIEELGTITSIEQRGDGRTFVIAAATVLDGTRPDDSISVNGTCLTVTERTDSSFTVSAVAETLRKTTIGELILNQHVNLERAVRLVDRLGGHLVQGHIDTTGTIVDILRNDLGWEMWIEFPQEYRRWIIPVGSLCVDGVSLTVAALEESRCKVALIPHTLEKTTFSHAAVGQRVNLEFDVIAKYVDNLYHHSEANVRD